VLIPLFMQELLGFPAITAGFWNSPRGIATMFLMPLAGFLIGRRWDMRLLLFGGMLVSAAGIYSFSYLNLNSGPWSFLWPQIVMGAGLSFTFVPLATITVDPIPSEEMGYATSIIALLRNVGASIGISIVATLLARRRQLHQSRLVAHLTATNPGVQKFLAGVGGDLQRQGSGAVQSGHQALALLYRLALEQAAVLSYLDLFRLLGVLFLFAAPLVWIMRKPQYKTESRPGPGPGPGPSPE
jgi:DHA2 family multidrug resistance protein